MKNKNIAKALDYIESHLKDDTKLNITALSKIAGYSEYHFLRLFRENVGYTPADYIRKRRISEIAKRIGESRPISEIAFEYGFNSKENFTRAFKSEHNILPTEFKNANCSLRLFEPFEFQKTYPVPVVSVKFIEKFVLTAYNFGDTFPPNCWNKYNSEKRSLTLSGGVLTEDFGVMRWNKTKDCLEYYIGIPTELAKGNTDTTIEIKIEGGLYAVFQTVPATQHNFIDTIRKTWEWINIVWLPTSGYKRKAGFELESYIESSKKYSELIYVPLEKE